VGRKQLVGSLGVLTATRRNLRPGVKESCIPRISIRPGARASHDLACRIILLLLCFIIPVQPVFHLHTYRTVEAIILLMGVSTFLLQGAISLPPLVRWSLWIGVAGWLISTALSPVPLHSIDVGLLDFFVFYILLYLLIVHLGGRRDFAVAGLVFALGAGIVAAGQTVTIISVVREESWLRSIPPPVPVLPSAFLYYKNAVPLFIPLGVPWAYGNIDNYVSLWVLLLPWLIGMFYFFSSKRWLTVGLFALHAYAGLIVYSRGAILALVPAIALLGAFQFRSYRSLSPAILGVLFGFTVFTVDPVTWIRSVDGVSSFAETFVDVERGGPPDLPPLDQSGAERAQPRPPLDQPDAGRALPRHRIDQSGVGRNQPQQPLDQSGADRAQAWLTGISIAINSKLLGIGFGIYPEMDPVLTAPHSMAILRFAEGGLLSLISFVMLALYAPLHLLRMARERAGDMLQASCLCAVIAFMTKAILFGANFAISSNIVWAAGTALCLATCLAGRSEFQVGEDIRSLDSAELSGAKPV
jgi:hypothetical protein